MAVEATASARSELVLGRYRPLQPLGSGGNGSVWLALDEETGAEVALKIVPREGNAHARTKREAAAAARLRHERCIRAYAFGADAEHVYIASEYVPGRTLRHALRAGELDDAAAVEAAAQILEGLAHAHEHGIVHRDVKPSNVLLADGEELSVRLLDFGLALMQEAESLTAVGDVPGTLAYISPERLRGETACPASDVWGVGVLLWEALAGEHPFWSGSLLETGRRIQAGAPSLADVRPDLPQPLIAAVDRALSRDPSRRPPAARLAAALRAALRSGRRERPSEVQEVVGPARAVVSAALAAAVAGWTAQALPFYPALWPLFLAAIAGLTMLVLPRAGLAVTLAVPVLPIGNVSLGAGLLYGACALAWLVLYGRRPRDGVLFALGPPLALAGVLAALPLAAQGVRGTLRRFLQVAAGVLAAAAVAALQRDPITVGGRPPVDGLARTESPVAAARAVGQAIASAPDVALAALVLALAAALLPAAASRGSYALVGWAAATLALAVLPGAAVGALPLGIALAATCVVTAARAGGRRRTDSTDEASEPVGARPGHRWRAPETALDAR